MIILEKLYSKTGLIDPVVFRPGINLILGRYSNYTNREINGIGKSMLVRLIDYCFLSLGAKKKHFNTQALPFLEGHSISLDFRVGDKRYTLKRDFSNNSYVLFGEDSHLNSYTEGELREILGSLLFKSYGPTYYEPNWFRTLLKFFIKDDLNHKIRKSSYDFIGYPVKKNLLVTYNLYLFGLPNSNLYQLHLWEEDLSRLRSSRAQLIQSMEKEFGKPLEELAAELAELEKRVEAFRKVLEELQLAETFRDLEENLLKLSAKISELLARIHKVKRELEYIRESYKVKIEIDIEETVNYYKRLKRDLGDFIKKSLEEVIAFRKRLADNRKKFLAQKEKELSDELDRLWSKYKDLEEKRRRIYQVLDSKGSLDVLKNLYQAFLEEMTRHRRLKEVFSAKEILDKEILDKEQNVEMLYYTIMEDYESHKEDYERFNLLFREVARNCTATSEGSYLAIITTQDRYHPIDIKTDIPKSYSHGREQLKLLLYDLTIFHDIVEKKKPMPWFLIHDGLFHGIDIKTKIRTLNYIHQLLKEKGGQYIATFNEAEIYQEYGGENLSFSIEESTIALFEDRPERMLFKREF